jgi:hypothetical protein
LADAHLAKQPAATTSKMMISTEGLPAIHLHTQGGDFLDQTYFLKRGDPNQKVEPVTPSFWPVMMKDADSHWIEKPPSGWRTSYRRRSLANWMVDVDRGAGRLLARVIVNRLWQHLLGKGIAQTPSDIGLHGDPPTHPELLEWLTSDFVHEGWHLKPIIRSIVMSSVYRESAQVSGKSFAADPQDTLLDISGLLDRTMAGPGTLDFASRRRSIYFTIKRSQLIPMLCVFDFPDPLQGVAERPTTTIAPQALALMNNPQVRIWAGGFAARLTNIPSLEGKITEAYHIALGRPPLPDEQRDGLAFILAQTAAHGDANNPQNQLAALTDFAQVLLCLNETIYVE